MADFCQQCSLEIFQEDGRELAGLLTEAEAKNGLFASVLCEGCGPTLVNREGVCVSPDCIEKHGKPSTPPLEAKQ